MSGSFKWYPGARAAISGGFAAALNATAADIVADVAEREVVPHAEGARKQGHVAGRLASSVYVEPAVFEPAARIVWDTEFAARAYYHPEWEFGRDVHTAAKGRWMDDYTGRGERRQFVFDSYKANLRRQGVFR